MVKKSSGIYIQIGPIFIKTSSDDGIHEELRELLKYYPHRYSDFGIFINKSSICIQKVSFGKLELMKKTTDSHGKSSRIGNGAELPEQMKHIVNLCLYLTERSTGEGAASSSRLGCAGAPAKDKKTPKKKKKESNKDFAALKKKETNKQSAALKKKESNKELAVLKRKAAQEKAKHLKTVRDLKKAQLLESIKKNKEMVEKRRLLIQKNKKKLNAKKTKNMKRDK